MDRKTKQRVLRYFMENPSTPPDYSTNVLKNFPDLSPEIINAALVELKNDGLVVTSMGGGSVLYAQVTQLAHGYFRELEEEEQRRTDELKAKKAEKWDERRWNIFASSITALICGIALFLLKWFVTGNP